MLLGRLHKHITRQNWFAVGLDFLIVVFGVGAALLGQQWLGNYQQREDMERAETAVNADLISNYINAKERLAVADCRVEAYQAIAEKLLEPTEDWTGMPRMLTDPDFNTIKLATPIVLRSPSRTWGSRFWDAELGRGTFNQMDSYRRNKLDWIFTSAKEIGERQRNIYTLQGRMKTLAVATKIGQSDRLRYLDMLGEIDDASGMLEIVAGQVITAIEDVGVDIPVELLQSDDMSLSSYNERTAAIYGDCVIPTTFHIFDKYLSDT
jgi:hypothetical protein